MKSHLLVYLVTAALLLLADRPRSFVDSAPPDQSKEAENDDRDRTLNIDEVKQLEDLKESLGKTFSVLKTQSSVYSNVNGQKESHAETKEQVKSDGKLLARMDQKVDSSQDDTQPDSTPATRIRTEVEIPSRGIHKTVVEGEDEDMTETVERRSAGRRFNDYSGMRFSPFDMAEYILFTGDEKGVTQAIQDILQAGLMSREEAITFLEQIKLSLELIQDGPYKKKLHDKEEHQQSKERERVTGKGIRNSKDLNEIVRGSIMAKKNILRHIPTGNNNDVSEDDYEELLESLRMADFLYSEYSLEEVVYHLAKVMFTQSLHLGGAVAQDSLQKFTTFLEGEAEDGHISKTIEKKVIDVMIAALTDTLEENPELVDKLKKESRQSNAAQLLERLMMLNPNKEEKKHSSKLGSSL